MQPKFYRIIPILVLISLATQTAMGECLDWKSVGLRAGMNDNRNNEDFHQYETFAAVNLPWIWHSSKIWAIGTYLWLSSATHVQCSSLRCQSGVEHAHD